MSGMEQISFPFCLQCGRPTVPNQRFCPNCGAKIAASSALSFTSSEREPLPTFGRADFRRSVPEPIGQLIWGITGLGPSIRA